MEKNLVHMVLMGKGGVGKSFVASLLAQHLAKSNQNLFCADTDPTNATFSTYKFLNVSHYDIMTEDMNIDKSRFDDLIENIAEHEGPVVIDNGASSFLPMMAYALESDFIDFLKQNGKEVIVHPVLIGGQGQEETMRMLAVILEKLPVKVVVWENELFGPIRLSDKAFADTRFYAQHKEQILGIVQIQQRSPDTFGKDLDAMTKAAITFAELPESPAFRLMSKQRLAVVERDIEAQLNQIFVLPESCSQKTKNEEISSTTCST